MSRALGVICMALLLSGGASAQQRVLVPFGVAPTVDGDIGTGEWRGSAVAFLGDSSQVQLRHDGRYLYIAVQGVRAGFVSACVSRNDTIRVLHASAALGTAMYVPGDSGWRLTTPFTWAVRASAMNDETRARQQAFLASSRWLASTSQLSGTAKEMQIDLSLSDSADLRVGLGYHVGDHGPVLPFPRALSDACVDARLVAGHLPATARFTVARWLGLASMRRQ